MSEISARNSEPTFVESLQGMASFCETAVRSGGMPPDDLSIVIAKLRDAAFVVDQLKKLRDELRNGLANELRRGQREGRDQAIHAVVSYRVDYGRDCPKLGFMDPETGAIECSMEAQGYDCLCSTAHEALDEAISAIRALNPPMPEAA